MDLNVKEFQVYLITWILLLPLPCLWTQGWQLPGKACLVLLFVFFFSSSMADVALWLGPYMSISSKNVNLYKDLKVRKCKQITTNQPTHRPVRRPANPPARLAFRQEKQQTRHTKGAGAQTKTPTKKICQRTQWSDHCITLKNMQKWIKNHDIQEDMKA